MKKKSTASIATLWIAIGTGTLLAVAAPLSASAHVTISPNTAPAGSYALVTVKVPNESATAVTNKVEIDIPTDTPFSSVSYVPVAGWTVEAVTETLPKPVKITGGEITKAVTKVTWTAQPGSEIAAGQLQLFPLSVGAVPNTGKIVLKALQTYSDGTVVSWTGTGENAEHPAPVLYVNDAPASAHRAAAGPTVEATEVPAPATVAASSDVVARSLGIGGLVLGAVGAVLGIVAFRREATR
ncbi:MAG: YcnI family protein [Lacisediminihabitans sp.]